MVKETLIEGELSRIEEKLNEINESIEIIRELILSFSHKMTTQQKEGFRSNGI